MIKWLLPCSKKTLKKRHLLMILVFGFVTVLYVSRATFSSLWFDEATEYFYSKTWKNMYHRIISTYQPPLYNYLMYIWLIIKDSEFWFRLAGIVVTLAGGVGLYNTLFRLCDEWWAAAGAASYLLTGAVSEYALECAEYNLLLCMLCWSLFFWTGSLQNGRSSDIYGFFLFACLSVYSQYGAVFIIVPMYSILVFRCINQNTGKSALAIGSTFSLAAAVILIRFFLLPQMERIGAVAAPHTPQFSYGFPLLDIIICLGKTGHFIFSRTLHVQLLIVGFAGIFLIVALHKADYILKAIAAAFCCAWLLYYVAVACSFYGLKVWEKNSFGTKNIGGRYCLFITPLTVVLLVYGVYCSYRRQKLTKLAQKQQWIKTILSVMLISYIFVGLATLYTFDKKDDMREVVQLWYELDSGHQTTVTHAWSNECFQYYLTHDSRYSETMQQNILNTGWWFDTADQRVIQNHLIDMGIKSLDRFYFILPVYTFSGNYDLFINALLNLGFHIDVKYKSVNALVYVQRDYNKN